MKIYLNREPVEGPWGGGNKTLSSLCKRLKEIGHELTFDLERDIDIIFCYDPRPNKKGVWYQNFLDYKASFKNTKILQRVGDVGTHSKPDLTKILREIASKNLSDFYIFPSHWSRKMINHTERNFSIIENRPMSEFYYNRTDDRVSSDQINIVTHHWSTNDKKGFEIYSMLGEFLNGGTINGKSVRLTYIGRFSEKYSSLNIQTIPPVDVETLSRKIPENDFYLTASLEEAGANHVLEALACGLPVLYRTGGGSINEYCKGFGLEYSSFEGLISSIERMDNEYSIFKNNVSKYSEKVEDSIDKYIRIIEDLENEKS